MVTPGSRPPLGAGRNCLAGLAAPHPCLHPVGEFPVHVIGFSVCIMPVLFLPSSFLRLAITALGASLLPQPNRLLLRTCVRKTIAASVAQEFGESRLVFDG
jgi:hypothetical protein